MVRSKSSDLSVQRRSSNGLYASANLNEKSSNDNKALGHVDSKRFAEKRQSVVSVGSAEYREKMLPSLIEKMKELGGVTLNINFNDDIQEEVRKHGLTPFKKRFDEHIRRRLGSRLLSLFCLDIDNKGRLHVHGAILAHANHRKIVNDAARAGGGKFNDVQRHRTQIQSSSIHDALGWARYISRNLWKLASIPGQRIVYSRELIGITNEFTDHSRNVS